MASALAAFTKPFLSTSDQRLIIEAKDDWTMNPLTLRLCYVGDQQCKYNIDVLPSFLRLVVLCLTMRISRSYESSHSLNLDEPWTSAW